MRAEKQTLIALEKCFKIANELRLELLEKEQEQFYEASVVDNSGDEFIQSDTVDAIDEIRTELDLLIGKLKSK